MKINIRYKTYPNKLSYYQNKGQKGSNYIHIMRIYAYYKCVKCTQQALTMGNLPTNENCVLCRRTETQPKKAKQAGLNKTEQSQASRTNETNKQNNNKTPAVGLPGVARVHNARVHHSKHSLCACTLRLVVTRGSMDFLEFMAPDQSVSPKSSPLQRIKSKRIPLRNMGPRKARKAGNKGTPRKPEKRRNPKKPENYRNQARWLPIPIVCFKVLQSLTLGVFGTGVLTHSYIFPK